MPVKNNQNLIIILSTVIPIVSITIISIIILRRRASLKTLVRFRSSQPALSDRQRLAESNLELEDYSSF